MESLRFIHAADLHLDSPFRGAGDVSPELREKLQAATMGALGRIVDHTISAKADFLVIAGDLYDSRDRSLRALLAKSGYYRDVSLTSLWCHVVSLLASESPAAMPQAAS